LEKNQASYTTILNDNAEVKNCKISSANQNLVTTVVV